MHWWFPWIRVSDTTDEAAAVTERLDRHDPEIAELGDELRERQETNNFSRMVAAALARVAAGPR